jgi:parvulin-like peptidyl-prolyl isomerase
VLFGDAIADALFGSAPGEWQGPYESDFGLHLVRLIARSASSDPPYEQIREQVLAAYAAQRREEANAAEYRRMRDRYEVVIEWPDETAASSPPAAVSTEAGQ